MALISKRYKVAELDYATYLTSVLGTDVKQVSLSARPGSTQLNSLPAFTLNWDTTTFKGIHVVGKSVIKRLHFEGLLFTASAGNKVGDARDVGQPIIELIDVKLLGHTPDFSAYPEIANYERVDPTYTGEITPVQLSVGGYALLIKWYFDMTFTKGVA